MLACTHAIVLKEISMSQNRSVGEVTFGRGGPKSFGRGGPKIVHGRGGPKSFGRGGNFAVSRVATFLDLVPVTLQRSLVAWTCE